MAPRHPGSASFFAEAPFSIRRTRADWQTSRLAVLAEMAYVAATQRPDLLLAGHLNVLPSAVLGGLGRPRAALVYGSELWATQTRLVTRALASHVDLVVAISRFTASEAIKAGFGPRRVAVLAPGGDEPCANGTTEVLDRLGLTRDGQTLPFLLTVSRLSETHKGHDIVIRAMPALLKRHPELRYVIAGDGVLADDLARLADQVGVSHAVMITPADRETKSSLLRACRAFVMVSRQSRNPPLFEGFGIAYIEAALAGRPSLAGASGGVEDAVVHEQTGLVVDPRSVSAVTAAALRLLDDPALADSLGARGQMRARADFTWEAACARIERSLESMVR